MVWGGSLDHQVTVWLAIHPRSVQYLRARKKQILINAGELHRQAAEAKAERIIAEELQRNGWCEPDLAARRKQDATELAIAARLRRETILPLKAIAARLWLGTSKSANGKLHEFMKTTPAASNSGQLAVGS